MSGSANQLKKEEENEFREIFKIYDKDNDGFITPQELGSVMRTQNLTFTEEELKAFVEEWGKTQGGKLNVDELLNLRKKQIENRTDEQELRDAFLVFDKKRDGLIDKDVLKNALIQYGENVAEKDAEELLSIAPLDDKNRIKVEEFIKILLGQ